MFLKCKAYIAVVRLRLWGLHLNNVHIAVLRRQRVKQNFIYLAYFLTFKKHRKKLQHYTDLGISELGNKNDIFFMNFKIMTILYIVLK